MSSSVALLFPVLLLVISVNAQFPPRSSVKPGSCSPPIGPGVCAEMCRGDHQCPGIEKCCKTGCGGTICSVPVPRLAVKAGSCPSVPTGPWVCSHTCTTDADCRGKLKCCRNRCDALACQKPE